MRTPKTGESKFQEVLSLAKNAYKGDAKTRAEFEAIESSLNVSVSGVLKTRARRFPLIFIGLVVVAILCVVGFASTWVDGWKVKQCEEEYVLGAAAEGIAPGSDQCRCDGQAESG